MSSNAGTGGGEGGGATTPAVNQQYYCYQCNRTISMTPSLTGELVCPTCNGGFLEEIENPNPNANPNSSSSDSNPNFNNPFLSFSDSPHGLSGIPLMFSSSFGGGGGSMEAFGEADLLRFFGGGGAGGGGSDSGDGGIRRSSGLPQPEAFDPFSFLQSYLQNLRAGGANIQLVINNNQVDIGEGFGGGGGGRGMPAIFGDYVIGSGLEQLMQQLAENDPNRYGTPPAAKSAVEGLPDIKITKDLLESDSSQCAVCKDEFELGVEAKQMPCKHLYHPDCIIPWLELHNSCPVCRYELPTDDPDYENREGVVNRPGVAVAMGDSDGSGGTAQENSPSPRTAERRFRISFPWPFRGLGAHAETSDTNSGNNNSEASSGERGGPNSGNEPREPGLD